MTTFRNELAQPYDIDWVNPLSKYVVCALIPDGNIGNNLKDLVTGEVKPIDTGTITYNSDGSISGTNYIRLGRAATFQDNTFEMNLLTDEFIYVLDYERLNISNGGAEGDNILFTTSGGESSQNYIRVVEPQYSTGLILHIQRANSNNNHILPTVGAGRQTIIFHSRGGVGEFDVYLQGNTTPVFTKIGMSTDTNDTLSKSLKMGVGGKNGKQYGQAFLVKRDGQFTTDELNQAITDPYSLFQTAQDEKQEYGLTLELTEHVITIDFIGSYAGEITYADDTIAAISGAGTYTLNGTTPATIKKITATHNTNVNEIFSFNRTKGDSVKSAMSSLVCLLSGFPSGGGYVRGDDGNIAGYKTPNREKFHIKATGLPIKSGLLVKLHLLEDIDLTGAYKRIFDSVGAYIATTNGGGTAFSSSTSDSKIDGVASSNLFNAKAGQIISFVVDVNTDGVFYFLGSRFSTDTEGTGTVLSLIEIFDGAALVASYNCANGDSDEIFNTVSTVNANIYNAVSAKWQPIFPTDYFTIGLEAYHDFTNLGEFITARAPVTNAWQLGAMDYLQVGNGGATLWHTVADSKIIVGAVKGKEFDGTKANAVGYDMGQDGFVFQAPLTVSDIYLDIGTSASGAAEVHAYNSLIEKASRIRTAVNSIVKMTQSYAKIKAVNSIFTETVSSDGNAGNFVDLTNSIMLKAPTSVSNIYSTVTNTLLAQSTVGTIENSADNVFAVDFTGAFVDSVNDDWRINQSWADANAVGQGWNGTDIVGWAYTDLVVAIIEVISSSAEQSVFTTRSDVQTVAAVIQGVNSASAEQKQEAITSNIELLVGLFSLNSEQLQNTTGTSADLLAKLQSASAEQQQMVTSVAIDLLATLASSNAEQKQIANSATTELLTFLNSNVTQQPQHASNSVLGLLSDYLSQRVDQIQLATTSGVDFISVYQGQSTEQKQRVSSSGIEFISTLNSLFSEQPQLAASADAILITELFNGATEQAQSVSNANIEQVTNFVNRTSQQLSLATSAIIEAMTAFIASNASQVQLATSNGVDVSNSLNTQKSLQRQITQSASIDLFVDTINEGSIQPAKASATDASLINDLIGLNTDQLQNASISGAFAGALFSAGEVAQPSFASHIIASLNGSTRSLSVEQFQHAIVSTLNFARVANSSNAEQLSDSRLAEITSGFGAVSEKVEQLVLAGNQITVSIQQYDSLGTLQQSLSESSGLYVIALPELEWGNVSAISISTIFGSEPYKN